MAHELKSGQIEVVAVYDRQQSGSACERQLTLSSPCRMCEIASPRYALSAAHQQLSGVWRGRSQVYAVRVAYPCVSRSKGDHPLASLARRMPSLDRQQVLSGRQADKVVPTAPLHPRRFESRRFETHGSIA